MKRRGQRKERAELDALAIRESYPAEEFAGFESFGESPEWQPGQAGESPDTSLDSDPEALKWHI